jgi:hypothetical protein
VHAPGGGVLDGEEREIGGSLAHGCDGAPEGVVAGQENARLAAAVAALRGEMAEGALDPLVGDP